MMHTSDEDIFHDQHSLNHIIMRFPLRDELSCDKLNPSLDRSWHSIMHLSEQWCFCGRAPAGKVMMSNVQCPPVHLDPHRSPFPTNLPTFSDRYSTRHCVIGQLVMTASQLNPSYECGEGMKVKVVKWCLKKWNWPILMHIYDKQCEIMQKNQ